MLTMKANVRKNLVSLSPWTGLPLAAYDLVDEWLLEEACERATHARPSAWSLAELARGGDSRHPSQSRDHARRCFGFSLDREIERWHRVDGAGLGP
jgi:hypothetical protein